MEKGKEKGRRKKESIKYLSNDDCVEDKWIGAVLCCQYCIIVVHYDVHSSHSDHYCFRVMSVSNFFLSCGQIAQTGLDFCVFFVFNVCLLSVAWKNLTLK